MDSTSPEEWVDRFGNEPRKGADIVVQCLEREGAHRVFAYPGGASMEIHQALTRSNLVKNTLCRHEQVGLSTYCSNMVSVLRNDQAWLQAIPASHERPGVLFTHSSCKASFVHGMVQTLQLSMPPLEHHRNMSVLVMSSGMLDSSKHTCLDADGCAMLSIIS